MNRNATGRGLLVVLPLVALAFAAGCGATAATVETVEGGGGGAYPEYTSLCGTPSPLEGFPRGLVTSPPIDGIVTRTETAFPLISGSPDVTPPSAGPEGDGWKGQMEGTEAGTLCATAKDKAACLATVQGYRVLPANEKECRASYPGFRAGCEIDYLIYTRGDAIGVARNADETRKLIGTYETVDEAYYAVTQAGYSKSCNGLPGYPDSMVRTTADGGFDFKVLQQENCGKTVRSVIVHVDYAGNVTEVCTETLPLTPECIQA